MKCSIMLHFIWVFTVCISTCLGVSRIQKVKNEANAFAQSRMRADVLLERLHTCGFDVVHSLFIVAFNVCGGFVFGLVLLSST